MYVAQGYPEVLVDPSVIQSSVQYLLRNQKATGKFDLIGRSHNHRLLVLALISVLCIWYNLTDKHVQFNLFNGGSITSSWLCCLLLFVFSSSHLNLSFQSDKGRNTITAFTLVALKAYKMSYKPTNALVWA